MIGSAAASMRPISSSWLVRPSSACWARASAATVPWMLALSSPASSCWRSTSACRPIAITGWRRSWLAAEKKRSRSAWACCDSRRPASACSRSACSLWRRPMFSSSWRARSDTSFQTMRQEADAEHRQAHHQGRAVEQAHHDDRPEQQRDRQLHRRRVVGDREGRRQRHRQHHHAEDQLDRRIGRVEQQHAAQAVRRLVQRDAQRVDAQRPPAGWPASAAPAVAAGRSRGRRC